MRYKTPFFLALLDIDFFKSINDKGGHLLGDEALVKLVKLIHEAALPGVFLARYGGDEFALIIEMDSAKDCVHWLEQLRKSFAKLSFQTPQGALKATISVGVTPFLPDKPTKEELFRRADKALYEAKNQGRNKTVLWPAAK
jgi:diguanylate cyclase (GGDEF)-like protein